MAGPLGEPGDALVGPVSRPKWAQGLLPRPLAPYVHICHLFGQTLVYFLHTNNSTSTSGTRWIINKILHMWWWFTSLYHAFGWNVMVKTGVSDRQQYSNRSVLIILTDSSYDCLALFFLLLLFFFFLVIVVSLGRYDVCGCPGDCKIRFLIENFFFLSLIVKQILALSM